MVDTLVAVLVDGVGIDAAGLPEREVRRIPLLGALVGLAWDSISSSSWFESLPYSSNPVTSK